MLQSPHSTPRTIATSVQILAKSRDGPLKIKHILVVDYHSKFIEVAKLSSTRATHVITNLKSIFLRHRIPVTVMSDNGPAAAFKEFANEYEFEHVTSSPNFPQANGMAERAVKTVKRMLKKNDYRYLAMMVYNLTPLENGYIPS